MYLFVLEYNSTDIIKGKYNVQLGSSNSKGISGRDPENPDSEYRLRTRIGTGQTNPKPKQTYSKTSRNNLKYFICFISIPYRAVPTNKYMK